jgi:hypothetical protein
MPIAPMAQKVNRKHLDCSTFDDSQLSSGDFFMPLSYSRGGVFAHKLF